MNPRLALWFACQLMLIAAWAFALAHGHVWMSLIPLALFAVRRMPWA